MWQPRGWWILIVGLMLLWTSPATSQIYRYRDAQGNLRVTDNLGDVPVDQRPQAQATEEIAVGAPNAAPATAAEKTEPPGNEAAGEAPEDPEAAEDAEIERLAAERAALEKMHQELLTTKAALEKEQAGLAGLAGRNKTAQDALALKVGEYNRNLEDYNKRNQAYAKQSQELLQRQVAPPPSE